ncbi:unnamed protein product [Meloidogyne enterolobii]|uniref:Uncharacterized protein n=1 Tax=Meloidogyne enterolobii TaxID=390850 RepID=A0ACB0ZEC1_MELEN
MRTYKESIACAVYKYAITSNGIERGKLRESSKKPVKRSASAWVYLNCWKNWGSGARVIKKLEKRKGDGGNRE